MLQRSVSPVSFFHPISVYLSSFLCKNHIFIVTTTNIQEVSPIQRAMLLVPVHHYRHTHYLYVDRQTDRQSSAFSTAPYRMCLYHRSHYLPGASDGLVLPAVTTVWPYGNSYFPMSVIYSCEYLKTLSTFLIAKLQCCISEVNWSLTAHSQHCVLHEVLFRKNSFKPQRKAISVRQWREAHNCIHRQLGRTRLITWSVRTFQARSLLRPLE